MPKRRKESVLERLLRRSHIPTNKDGTNSKSKCWTWTGPTNNAGYGMMKVSAEQNMVTVHRISMIEHDLGIDYGDSTQVLHECGNKLCVNPHHLKLGTVKDRVALQRKYEAWNPMFKDKKLMNPVCEHCGTSTYLPWFKRKHALCEHNAKYKYITHQLNGNSNKC